MKSPHIKKSAIQVKSKSWANVLEFFTKLAEANLSFQPMLDFVSEVANSRFSEGLFPTTSMHDVWISQTEIFEMYYEVLVIKFDFKREKFLFQYFETPYAKDPWERECNVDDAFKTFERFLELKAWFLKTSKEQPQ
jgi:hypothetical protein